MHSHLDKALQLQSPTPKPFAPAVIHIIDYKAPEDH